MAGFILCRTKYADKPYYISNMAINIYSLEELCYYIYNNIYLIGTDLISPELISYIDRELEEKELAEQLSFLTEQNAGLSELVITVLRYVDYYSENEIAALKTVIEQLDTQNASERLKARADNFLNNKRYSSAIRNYELIVYSKRDNTLNDIFYGSVWHNMGVAYARMFSFYDAEICFKTAYELNRDDESQKAAMAAAYLYRGGEDKGCDDEMMYVTGREIETIMDHAVYSREYESVKKAFELKSEGQIKEYYDALDNLIGRWKAEYRNYIK